MSTQKQTNLEIAKYAGYIQTAISLLHSSLKNYIRDILRKENATNLESKIEGDFSESLKFIRYNWRSIFSKYEDEAFLREVNVCINIRNKVSHQTLCFDRDLESLIVLGKKINSVEIDEFVDSIFNPTPPSTINETSNEQKKVKSQKKITKSMELKNRGNDYFKQQKWTEAMIEYSKAICLDSTQPLLYSNRALCELKLEKYDLARCDAEQAIYLDKTNVKFYRILSECLMSLQLYQEALDVCEQGLKYDAYDETLLLRKRNANARATSLLSNYRDTSTEINKENFDKLMKRFEESNELSLDESEVELIEHPKTIDKYKSANNFLFQAHQCRDGVLGAQKNLTKAFELYNKAAKLGSAEALVNLGNFYANGINDLPIDYDRMLNYWQKAIELKPYLNLMGARTIPHMGVAEAWCAIGNCYREGRGVDPDYQKAFEHYKKSAKYGCHEGMNNLGHMLENGLGIKQDHSFARSWYKKAADEGRLASAQMNLGRMLRDGLGGPKDEKLAYEYFKKAADQGSPGALEFMQQLSISGVVSKKQKDSFESFLSKQESDENAEGLYVIGANYYKGTNGYTPNLTKSYEYLKRASEMKHHKANCLLLELLVNDLKRNKEAFDRCLQASQNPLWDSIEVNKLLMKMYAYGHGCKRDEEKARMCFRRNFAKTGEENKLTSPESLLSFKDENIEDMIEMGGKICEFEEKNGLSSESLTIGERAKRYLDKMEGLNSTERKILSELTKIAEKGGPKPASMLKNFLNDKSLKDLALRAEKGSITALNYLQAYKLKLDAIEFLEKKQYAAAFSLFVDSYKLWDIFMLPSSKAARQFRQAIEQTDCDKDKNAMFCKLIGYFNNDIEGGLLFAKRCINIHPQEAWFHHHLSCLYAFTSDYKKSLQEIIRAIELEHNPAWLYTKASCLRLLAEQEKCKQSSVHKTIAAYEEYIKASPCDDRKIVEAYYSIGNLYFYKDDTANAKVYWKKAQIAEHPSVRLPILEPVDNVYKIFVNMVDLLGDKSNGRQKKKSEK